MVKVKQIKRIIINNFYDWAYRDGTTKFMRLYHISRCINWHDHNFVISIKRIVCKWPVLSNVCLGCGRVCERKRQKRKKNISSYIYGLFIEWWKFYKPINMVLFLWNTRDCVTSVEMDWKPTYKFITNISRFCRVLIVYFCIFA